MANKPLTPKSTLREITDYYKVGYDLFPYPINELHVWDKAKLSPRMKRQFEAWIFVANSQLKVKWME